MTDQPQRREPFCHPRLEREWRTMKAMLHLYCRLQHGGRGELCAECSTLADYALQRLTRCPYGAEKPTCAHCPVHCYQPRMRTRIRGVMRYAGPRMVYHHPLLALLHVADGLRDRLRRPGGGGDSA